MTLVAYYVDFFMGNTKKKTLSKLDKKLAQLHNAGRLELLLQGKAASA